MPLRISKTAKPLEKRYFERAKQPLHMLIFLLPLIVAYEFALYSANHRDPSQNIQIKVHDHLVKFLEYADLPPTQGLWFGGVLIIATLLIWQINSSFSWRVDLKTITTMAIEAIAATIPLLALGAVFGNMIAASSSTAIGELTLFDKLAVSIGAGLYEEFVFRMLVIALVHTIAIRLFKQTNEMGLLAGILLSAILFAMYHDLPDAGTLPAISLFFYGIAGIYLGLLFVFRGFGITAATHTIYDVVATTILAVIAV